MKKFYKNLFIGIGVSFISALAVQAQVTFTNASPITVPGGAPATTTGIASPYPSTINVTGLPPILSNVTVTLFNMQHTWPSDFDIVLVSPTGTSVVLTNDAIGGSGGITGRTYTFDQAAPTTLPNTGFPASGTYRPATGDALGDNWPAPGPGALNQLAPTLADYNGQNPNGNWNLYIYDDASGDVGAVNGGWSITITTPAPCVAPPTAGTTTSTAMTPCSGGAITLGLTGSTSGVGQTWQWESSPDAIAWTPIPAATSASYNTTISIATYFRCVVTCSAMNDTSSEIMVSPVPCFNMTNGSITTCSGNFYDSGGPAGNYGIGEVFTYTITPNPGNYAQVNFTAFQTEANYDGLMIYDGPDATYPLIPSGLPVGFNAITAPANSFYGTVSPGTITGTSSSGALTFVYRSDGSVVYAGWAATVNCIPKPANDAALLSILSPTNPPSSGCVVNDTIIVAIGSYGTDTLNTLDISYTINGGTPVVYNWTGALGEFQTDTVFLGVTALVDGDHLEVYTSNPNGMVDEVLTNDSAEIDLYDPLNGPYTVYGPTPDFNNLTDAVTALTTRGVCGNVIFNVRAGTYNEHVSILPYLVVGGGSGYTVTIQSEDLDASLVKFDFAPVDAPTNYIVQLNGADNIILNELTLSNTSYFARVIEYKGGANDNLVHNCVIIGDTLAAADNFDKITIVSTLDNDNNNKIINNKIMGGGRAISLGGISLINPEVGATIDSNEISKYYFVGSAVFNQTNPVMNNNTFSTNSTNPNVFRMYMNNVNNGFQIVHNRTFGNQGGFGINLDNASGAPAGDVGYIANNFIFMGDTTGATNSEGIYIQNGSALIDIVNNSIHVGNLNPVSSAVSIGVGTGGSNSVNLWNNNLANTGSGRAVTVVSNYNFSASNRNNLYAESGNLVNYIGTNYTTVAAYTAASGFDVNSVAVDPLFVGDDLHTCRVELDNTASVYTLISTDFDGDTRTGTPDIGADEFIGANFDLGSDIIKCPNDTVVLGAEIIASATYYWAPFFQTTPTIMATDAGTYIAQVTSACGASVDTIIITEYPLPVSAFTTSLSFYTVITTNNSTNGVGYLWNFGDGNTSTDFEPSHVYADNGEYVVTLTVYSACGDSAVFTRPISVQPQFAGVEDEGLAHMNVYPDPSEGQFALSFTSTSQEDVIMTIMDLSGRTVYQRNFGVNEGQFLANIDLRGNISAGTYLIRVQSGKYTAHSKMIIK